MLSMVLITLWMLNAGIQLVSAAEKVTVLTSYPQEMISHFEESFEQRYPQYRLEVIWKQSNDALAFLNSNPGTVDVYWAPSRGNFVRLAKEGHFQAIDSSWITAPKTINGTSLNDPKGFYAATEIAGLGMVVNQDALNQEGIKPPTDWEDLKAPAFKGKIAFPIPTKVGFAGGLIDAILKNKSWEEGWSLLTQLGINSNFRDNGSTFVTDEVVTGKVAVGITMDFFAASAIAKGAALIYVYPSVVGYSPAHVAILKDAPHKAGAAAFTRFTLSEDGQKVLFDPDIRKLPVDPAVYRFQPRGYFNPFITAAVDSGKNHDLVDQAILNAFFEATIVKQKKLLDEVANQYNQAINEGKNQKQLFTVWQQFTQPLSEEQELLRPENYLAFKNRKEDPKASAQAEELERAWEELAVKHYRSVQLMFQAI